MIHVTVLYVNLQNYYDEIVQILLYITHQRLGLNATYSNFEYQGLNNIDLLYSTKALIKRLIT